MTKNPRSPSAWGLARMAFIAAIPEITRRLTNGEPGTMVWGDLFAPQGQTPKMTYQHYTKLVRQRLPQFSRGHNQSSVQPRVDVPPQPPSAAPLTFDPSISGTGPRPLPPPLPKMPSAIRPGPVQPQPSPSDTGPPPGSTEWKKLHGLETSNRPRELIKQRVPDGKLSGDEP